MAITANNPNAAPDSFFGGYLQPGATDSINDVGIRTLRQSYVNAGGNMELPVARSAHPNFIDLFLKSASIVKQKGDYDLMEVVYEGAAPGGGDANINGAQGNPLFEPVTGLSRTVNQEPLDSHSNFSGTSDSIVGQACNNDGTSEDPNIIIRDSDGAFKVISNEANDVALRGVSSYLVAGAEYTVRYADESKPNLENVGRVVESLPLNGPDVGGDFNWLLSSIDYEQKGEVYEITERYLLSGANGWADSIYNYTLS